MSARRPAVLAFIVVTWVVWPLIAQAQNQSGPAVSASLLENAANA